MIRDITDDLERQLELRLGRTHARQRLGIERDHEQRVFGDGTNFLHFENWRYSPALIGTVLKLLGLHWRGRRNAERLEVRENVVRSARIPKEFDGFTILHISDTHIDMSDGATCSLLEILPELSYDICVLTGNYRGKTYEPFDQTLTGLSQVLRHLKWPTYGILGNHDTIAMVPGLECLGVRMQLNETETLTQGSQSIYLAGIDDAHYYRVHNIEKAAGRIPDGEFSILLSHTPEGLSPGSACRFRPAAQRAHPRWADMFPRFRADNAGFGTAAPPRFRYVEISGHSRIYVLWTWHLHCPRAIQLLARNNARMTQTARPAAWLKGRAIYSYHLSTKVLGERRHRLSSVARILILLIPQLLAILSQVVFSAVEPDRAYIGPILIVDNL